MASDSHAPGADVMEDVVVEVGVLTRGMMREAREALPYRILPDAGDDKRDEGEKHALHRVRSETGVGGPSGKEPRPTSGQSQARRMGDAGVGGPSGKEPRLIFSRENQPGVGDLRKGVSRPIAEEAQGMRIRQSDAEGLLEIEPQPVSRRENRESVRGVRDRVLRPIAESAQARRMSGDVDNEGASKGTPRPLSIEITSGRSNSERPKAENIAVVAKIPTALKNLILHL